MDNSVIDKFSKHLFWDVDRNELDLDKHRKFIVQRVLERGHDKDWELLDPIRDAARIRRLRRGRADLRLCHGVAPALRGEDGAAAL